MVNSTQLTAEQIQYVLSLPKHTVIVGGREQTLACDMEKKLAFVLDGNGRPTGRASKLSEGTISHLIQDAVLPDSQAGPSDPSDSDEALPDLDQGNRTNPSGQSDRMRKLARASDT